MQGTEFAPWEPGSWGDSIWAGLPHLLLAILAVVTGVLGSISGLIFALVFLGGFLATIYYTWKNHWPAWSASWYGYIGLIILLFSILPYQGWVGMASQIFEGIRVFLTLLCLATLLYWLSRRNPIEALLMAIPLIIIYWLPVMEFIPNSIRFWLTFWLFLLSALTAMTIARVNNIQKAVWLGLGASLLVGLPIAYARTYWNNLPPEHASLPTIVQMVELFSVPWLASAALALGPILGWGIWYFGKTHGRTGRIGATIIVFGMIINLLGHFSHWWVFSNETYLNALQINAIYTPNASSSLSMVYGGLALTLVGVIALIIPPWKQSKLFSIPLILTTLALPLVAMFTTYFGYYIVPAGFSFEFARLGETYKYLVFVIGALWLLMSGWTVTHLYNPPLREEAV